MILEWRRDIVFLIALLASAIGLRAAAPRGALSASRGAFPRTLAAQAFAAAMKPLRVQRTNAGAHNSLTCAPRCAAQPVSQLSRSRSSSGLLPDLCEPEHSWEAASPASVLAQVGAAGLSVAAQLRWKLARRRQWRETLRPLLRPPLLLRPTCRLQHPCTSSSPAAATLARRKGVPWTLFKLSPMPATCLGACWSRWCLPSPARSPLCRPMPRPCWRASSQRPPASPPRCPLVVSRPGCGCPGCQIHEPVLWMPWPLLMLPFACLGGSVPPLTQLDCCQEGRGASDWHQRAPTHWAMAPPAADGQATRVTTLLRPATARAMAAAAGAAAAGACSPAAQAQHAQRAQHEHVEPLGLGLCSFQLASPPCAATERLIRALLHQLDRRLCLEAAEGAAGAALSSHLAGGAAVAAATSACRRQAGLEGPGRAAALPACTNAEAGAMPADCFWASF